MQNLLWLEVISQSISDVILPIVVAVITYLLVDRLGEWRKRKSYSTLGVAIIESLQEEVSNGIRIMTEAVEAANDESANSIPAAALPNQSWSGMSTIPDDVLLRIIEVSESKEFEGHHPRDCWIHTKNYFVFICKNYQDALNISMMRQNVGSQPDSDWRAPIQDLLADERGHYTQAAKRYYQLLEDTRNLLVANAKAIFPK